MDIEIGLTALICLGVMEAWGGGLGGTPPILPLFLLILGAEVDQAALLEIILCLGVC